MNSLEQIDRQRLATTISNIHCDDKSGEEWTTQLAREVLISLLPQYGEISEQLVDHIVCETLFKISGHLRLGHPVTLEGIGTLLPAEIGGDRCVTFRPCDCLFEPMSGHPATVIKLADRRQGVRHG